MTITGAGAGTATLDQGASPDDPPPAPGPVRRRLLAGLGVVAVLGAAWWWSHPTVFGEVGDEFSARPDRLVPVYVDMGSLPEGARASIISASARVQVFGEAEADVVVCEGHQIGIVVGADGEQGCPGMRFHGDAVSTDQLVLRVTPVRPGTVVVVDGIDVTYTTGWQRGTEHTGLTGVVVFPDEP